ncbi:IS66 family transposase [Arthrobacter sp. AQ5-05]|nr:IS66 family transposase [Arthrobacter sp. AQ5-05]
MLARLEERDAALAKRDARIESLLLQLAERDVLITQLRTEVEVLKAKVATLEGRLKKNSQNSSKPPSTDAFVKPPPRSLRRSSGKSPGKQAGEPGMRLEPVKDPDVVLVHDPQRCGDCGLDLTGAPVIEERARQVFDLPPIHLVVTEHRVRTRLCSCGCRTEAPFPAVVSATTCYGPVIQGFGAYLMGRQHLPVARTAELLTDAIGAPVSTGWLSSLLPRAAKLLEPFLETTGAALRHAPVVHFDETGARVEGRLAWVHVACTDTMTLLHLAPGRSVESIGAGGILGHGFNGIAVHDGLPAYRRYPVQHGACNVHHLRELAGIVESGGQDWAQGISELLTEMLVAVNEAKDAGRTGLDKRALRGYRRRYRRLLAQGVVRNPLPPPTGKRGRPAQGPIRSLIRRLDDYQDDVLRFATDFRVPFGNNAAERAIRMVKLQQKISGTFRSRGGAEAFLAVRSYVGTALKQGKNVFDALGELFAGDPWLPATP